MDRPLLLTLISVAGVAFGQVLFKAASSRIDSGNLLGSLMLNLPLFFALLIYALATLTWIFALRAAPLSRLYPFFALSFIAVPLLEAFILKTELRASSILGGLIIAMGVWVAVKSG